MLLYVLIVCTVTLPPGVNPIAVDKYIYLSNNTIRSPDDEHCDARNMYRGIINKDIKSASSWSLTKNCNQMHGQRNIKVDPEFVMDAVRDR